MLMDRNRLQPEGLLDNLLGMPQSLSFNLIHLIFSTKNRIPAITQDIINDLHAYLSQVARKHDCECYRAGGVADHVHLAIRISRTLSVSQLVKELKSTSSKWMKTKSPKLSTFAWQRGYGSFSLSPKDLEALVSYIQEQEQHHQKKSFQEEYREFLKKYGVDYDERYVWD